MAPWILAGAALFAETVAGSAAGLEGLCADRGVAAAQRIASQRRVDRGWNLAAAGSTIFMRLLSLKPGMALASGKQQLASGNCMNDFLLPGLVPFAACASEPLCLLPEGGVENSPGWSVAQSGEGVASRFTRPVGVERTPGIGPIPLYAIAQAIGLGKSCRASLGSHADGSFPWPDHAPFRTFSGFARIFLRIGKAKIAFAPADMNRGTGR